MNWRGCLLLGFVAILAVASGKTSWEELNGHYLAEFAVEIEGLDDVADLVATSHNLKLVRKINGLNDVYLFSHPEVNRRSKRSADDVLERLKRDPNVKRVEQQRVLHRVKRGILHDKQVELPIRHVEDKSIYDRHYLQQDGLFLKDKIVGKREGDLHFIDPFWPDQWSLHNFGQTGGPAGYDVNVMPVWKKGITGKGITVCVLDDGVQYTHPDLQDNYDPEASADMNDKRDNDPMPNYIEDSDNSHGTRCAGEIAMVANNSICGVGIAYNSKIGGIRLLDGPVTDSLEADALTYRNQRIHIYSASWGPNDDGKTMEAPNTFAAEALKRGVKEGRGGKGSIFVWATGNGGQYEDDCNCDGYTSSIETLSVGCISDRGLSTYFSEVCPSTIAVIYTGGAHVPPSDKDYESPKLKITTTDVNSDCTLEFQGTSSAAPLAAGCFALVLEANLELTWRDMQHLVVNTARIPSDKEPGWSINGAGFHINHRFGFGAIDCGRMVEEAEMWQTVGPQHTCKTPVDKMNRKIRHGDAFNLTITVDGCKNDPDSRIDKLEHTQVHVKLDHNYRGDVNLFITSPCGTRSEILSPRPRDSSKDGIDFTFMTVHNWGENPVGDWILTVMDNPPKDSGRHNVGYFKSWSLILYGTEARKGENVEICDGTQKKWRTTVDKQDEGHIASEVEIKHIMADEKAEANHLEIEGREGVPEKVTSKTNMKKSEVKTVQENTNLEQNDFKDISLDSDISKYLDQLTLLLRSLDDKELNMETDLGRKSKHLLLAKKDEIPGVSEIKESNLIQEEKKKSLLNDIDKNTLLDGLDDEDLEVLIKAIETYLGEVKS